MLNPTERNRTQSICAGLIASTIVTADCADDTCVCATNVDLQCPSASTEKRDTRTLLTAELPVEGTLVFQLEPVVRSLAAEVEISVTSLPADLGYAEAFVDSVTQADPLLESTEGARSPRLSRQSKRTPSNQNHGRFAQELIMASPPVGSIESSSIADMEVEVQGPAKVPQFARPSSLMQDDYIAFGVNGR